MTEKAQINPEKLKVLSAVMDKIEKDFGKGAIMKMSSKKVDEVPVIPSGSITIDQALGIGGYPKGRVIEIFGPESSGKTTLAIHAIAEAQKAGGIAAFIVPSMRSTARMPGNWAWTSMSCLFRSPITASRRSRSPTI